MLEGSIDVIIRRYETISSPRDEEKNYKFYKKLK